MLYILILDLELYCEGIYVYLARVAITITGVTINNTGVTITIYTISGVVRVSALTVGTVRCIDYRVVFYSLMAERNSIRRSAVHFRGSEAFEIESVEGLSERKEKGRGCYGVVYEVRVHGVPCIAKRLHNILVGRGGEEPVSDEERAGVIQKFREEVNLLSRLRHPNVVQFLGVHYGCDKADISLIMEHVHMDLEHCITAYSNIPHAYKTSILRDVSYGLAYLHSMSIIHRDLNAGNVLLTESLKAKIADLGVAKLFDWTSAKHRIALTKCPGTLDFMPPESLGKKPKYDCKLDIFSVGHLILYLVNQEAPDVTDKTATEEDFKRHQVQAGKRREALNQMGGPDHPLYTTAIQCLSDNPENRPTSTELVKRMEEKCLPVPPQVNALELKFQLESQLKFEKMKMYQEVEQKKKQMYQEVEQEKMQMYQEIERVDQCLRKEHEQLTQKNELWRKELNQWWRKQCEILTQRNECLRKKLTQENECLRKECEQMTKENDCLRKEHEQLTQENERWRKVCEQLRYTYGFSKKLAHIQLQSSHQVCTACRRKY